MSFQTAGDVPIQISSETSGSERRISPSWSIGLLKSKLELITGIPPSSQRLALNRPGQPAIPIEAVDEEVTQLANFPLVPYAEIYVSLDAFFTEVVNNMPISRLNGSPSPVSNRQHHSIIISSIIISPPLVERLSLFQTPASQPP